MSWAQITVLEDAATAGSGAINAAVFLERTLRTRGPRRAAAALLTALFAAVVVAALSHLSGPERGPLDAVLRGPLVAACVAVTAVLALGIRR
jgi:hypothetical protein